MSQYTGRRLRGTGICQPYEEKEETQKAWKATIAFLTIKDQD